MIRPFVDTVMVSRSDIGMAIPPNYAKKDNSVRVNPELI